MSWSMSTSSGSTASGSIRSSFSSSSPLIFTVTVPRPRWPPPPRSSTPPAPWPCRPASSGPASSSGSGWADPSAALLIVEDFLGAELGAQALDQLVVVERRGTGGRHGCGGELERQRQRASGHPTHRARNNIATLLRLLLDERGILGESDRQAVAFEGEWCGGRERGTEHPVLLAHGLGDSRPQRNDLAEFDRPNRLWLDSNSRGPLRCLPLEGWRRRRGLRGLGRHPGRGLQLVDPEHERLERKVRLRLRGLQECHLKLDARLAAVLHGGDCGGQEVDSAQDLTLGEAAGLVRQPVRLLGRDREGVGHMPERLDHEEVAEMGGEVAHELREVAP